MEPTNPTTGSELDAGIQATIVEKTIFANAQYLVWDSFAMHREAAADGSGAVFPKMSALATATTPLSANSNPAVVQLADSTVTITTAEYGNPVELGKKLLRNSKLPVINDSVQVLAVNMAETRDAIAGAVAIAGSNVRFVNGRANAAALASGDVLSRAEIVRAWSQLHSQNAPPFDDGTFYAGIHPYALADLFASGANLGDFTDVSKYAAPEMHRTGEIGKFLGFSIFRASQRTYDDLSAGVGDVADRCLSVFAGKAFIGYAWSLEPAIIPAFDSNDRLKRFINLGWYGDFAYGRIREENGYRIESRSNHAPAP